MREVLLGVALAVSVGLTGCAHGGDPLPPRAYSDGPPVPEAVKDDPRFFRGISAKDNPKPAPEKKPDPCALDCPEGQRCETFQGVDRCVPNAGR